MHALLALLLSFTLTTASPAQVCAALPEPIRIDNNSWVQLPLSDAKPVLLLDVTVNATDSSGIGSDTPILVAASYGEDATLLKQWDYSPTLPTQNPTPRMVIMGNHRLLLAGTLNGIHDTLYLGVHGGSTLTSLTINSACTQSILYPLEPQ